mmetsp:Transcript_11535/g.21813  ORF Transcript_11535/g.21813 Transcript_11535/m.21813 type:complete len:214 (-) Transcript_11535:1441-2082(-)
MCFEAFTPPPCDASSQHPVPPSARPTQLASRGVSRVQSNTYLRLSLPRIPFISIGPQTRINSSLSSSPSPSFSSVGVILYFLMTSILSSVRGCAGIVRVATMHPSPMLLSNSSCISSSHRRADSVSTAPYNREWLFSPWSIPGTTLWQTILVPRYSTSTVARVCSPATSRRCSTPMFWASRLALFLAAPSPWTILKVSRPESTAREKKMLLWR